MRLDDHAEELLNGERLLTMLEVRGLLHVSRSYMYKLWDQGILPPVRIGERMLRYHPSDVRAYLKTLNKLRIANDHPTE